MIAILCAALAQDLHTEILRKTPEALLVVRAPQKDGMDTVIVRRWIATARDGVLFETWLDVSADLAETERGALRAEISLAQAGTYEVVLGSSRAEIRVSRADLRSWKGDLDQLRRSIGRLEDIAAAIDQAGTPSAAQAELTAKRLRLEAERLQKMKTEFYGTRRALEGAVDGLRNYRTLVLLPPRPEGVNRDYGGRPAPPNPVERKAAGEVKGLRDLLSREGMLVILDELALLVDPRPTSPGDVRILRWRDRAEALTTLRQGFDLLEGCPEVGSLLKDAQEGSVPEGLAARIRKEREALLKP